MATIVTRAGKGSPLTNTEVDANFTNLNNAKYEAGNNVSVGTLAASGAASFAAGSAGAPSIAATGDLNTGMFFPAADTIAFATGGVERARVMNTGKIGIGNTNPSFRFDLEGIFGETVARFLRLGDYGEVIRIGRSGVSDTASINYPSDGVMAFETAGAERLRIDAGGRFGLATANPTNILSLGGNFARTFWMERHTTADTAGNNLTVQAGGATSGATNRVGGSLVLSGGISTGSSGSAIIFQTATAGGAGTTDRTPSEKMRLTEAGNFGIGVTPGYPLHIRRDAAAWELAYLENQSSSAMARFVSSGGGSVDFGAVAAVASTALVRTAGVERVRFDASGNVVINTAAIATNAADGFLYVPSCAGTPTGTPTAYTGRVPIVVDTTNNKLYFYSGGAWRDAGP